MNYKKELQKSIKEISVLLDRANPKVISKYFTFFDNLDELAVKVLAWGHTFLPKYFSADSPEFHFELVKRFFSPDNEYTACPRGFGKTTIIQVCIMFSCCYKLDEFIVLIEKTFTEASEVLEAVREEFKFNVDITMVYGKLGKISPRMIKDERIKDAEGDFFINGVRLRGKGFDSPIRGIKSRHARPSRILLDDIESDEHIENPEQRRKYVNNYIKGIIPAASVEGGNIKLFGTILHDDSLLNTLIIEHKGIILKAWDENRKLLWPEYWTVEALEKKRKDMAIEGKGKGDASFYQEYFNEPISEEDQIFRKEMFRYYTDEELENTIKKRPNKVYVLCDPAISKKESADFTAIVAILVDNLNRFYILEIIRERLTPFETAQGIFALSERWRPFRVGIETQSYQKALQYIIEDKKKLEEGYLRTLVIEEIKAGTDKESKVKGLQPKYEQGLVFHRLGDSMTGILESELLRFPRGATDDVVDCVSSILQIVAPFVKVTKQEYNKFQNLRFKQHHVAY